MEFWLIFSFSLSLTLDFSLFFFLFVYSCVLTRNMKKNVFGITKETECWNKAIGRKANVILFLFFFWWRDNNNSNICLENTVWFWIEVFFFSIYLFFSAFMLSFSTIFYGFCEWFIHRSHVELNAEFTNQMLPCCPYF